VKIISVANTTGGSGKSTTALAVAVAAAEYGRNVLLIDLDERANLTFQLAIENPRFTLLEIATGSASNEVAIIRTNERIDFLPSAPRITALDTAQISIENLKQKFANYDLVVIDTSSALNQRLALAAELSDAVLYVSTDSLAAIRGVVLASDFFKKSVSLGVLPIMTIDQGSAISVLSGEFKVLDPAIPSDENVLMAQIENKSVLNYAKAALASDAYRDITYFLLEDLLGSKADATL
jgi:septum site-determining protein MinD